MLLTVKESLALPDRQLWTLGPVTISGYLYVSAVDALVDQRGDVPGILLRTAPDKERPIRERLFDSECCGFAIGGGTVVFASPSEITGRLRRLHLPMFPLEMEEIRDIVFRGQKAGHWEIERTPQLHSFSVLPEPKG